MSTTALDSDGGKFDDTLNHEARLIFEPSPSCGRCSASIFAFDRHASRIEKKSSLGRRRWRPNTPTCQPPSRRTCGRVRKQLSSRRNSSSSCRRKALSFGSRRRRAEKRFGQQNELVESSETKNQIAGVKQTNLALRVGAAATHSAVHDDASVFKTSAKRRDVVGRVGDRDEIEASGLRAVAELRRLFCF